MAPFVIPLLMAIAGGAGAASSAVSSSKQNKSQQAMTREQIAAEKEAQARDIALKESEMNPFRQQLAQAGSLSSLDQLERGAYKPVSVQGAAPYAQYKPQMSGGFSYEKSPELVAAAGALKKDVLAGNRAPSVLPQPYTPVQSGVGRTAPVGTSTVDLGTATARNSGGNPDATAVLNLLAMLFPDDPYAKQRISAGRTQAAPLAPSYAA